ncbi:MAG: peptide chain release factor N(5)-glutamine methyltransferase [Actinomycetaceae bacterium]|nr:peptide chain release factor N(5)-glutamine methyltransferase [Actinomycetaceae bacterium]
MNVEGTSSLPLRQQYWPRWIQQLTDGGVASPSADLQAIVEHVTAVPLYLLNDLAPGQVSAICDYVEKRSLRQPLQHLLGKQYFYGLELIASPEVFCVRPETELLVEYVLNAFDQRAEGSPSFDQDPQQTSSGEYRHRQGRVRILDLCTGSGAMAIALAKYLPQAFVQGVEIDNKALAVARQNAKNHGVEVQFDNADATNFTVEETEKFDVVVSNPPYVPQRALAPEALADPAIALWGGGEDGLMIPKSIVQTARECLKPAGLLVVEHDDTQGRALREHADNLGFTQVRTHRDLAARERYLSAVLPSVRQ